MPIVTSAFIAAIRATGDINAAKLRIMLVTILPVHKFVMGVKAAAIANRAMVARSKVLIYLATIT